MRTQEEIIERIVAIVADRSDFFGTRQEELIAMVEVERLSDPRLTKVYGEITATEGYAPRTEEQVREAAADYLEFAVGKAFDHRGLSAARSVDHYREWVWLLCTDSIVEEFEATDYASYGVPQLRFAAQALGLHERWEALRTPTTDRMADGLSCGEDWCSGCH